MVRAILAFFLSCAISMAQVTSIPTGCTAYFGPVNLTCISGSTPLGMFVDFEVNALNVQDMPFGKIVWLLVGFTNDTVTAQYSLPLPFDLGQLYPSLSGCSLFTSDIVEVAATAQRDGTCRLSFFFPTGFSGPFNVQAAMGDLNPAGFILSSNYLEYHNN